MSLNKQHCFKCENCGTTYFERTSPESLSHSNPRMKPFPCNTEMNIVRRYLIQKEDFAAWSDYLMKRLTEEWKADKTVRRRARIGTELKNNKVKRLIITGSFWMCILSMIFYLLFRLIASNINWGRLIAVLAVLPVLFTLLGTFILKSMDSLREESFIKLVKLTLQLNLKVLKELLNKVTKK